MGFYSDWAKSYRISPDDRSFINKFLLCDYESVQELIFGDEEELISAYNILSAVPLDLFLNEIEVISPLPFSVADVPCFSTLENGISRVNELLMFSPNGLTFSEIGYQLMESKTELARKKYGENHSKLAAIFSLVTLHRYNSYIVKPTNWGNFLTLYEYAKKEDILKKLALRNRCVMTMIQKAFKGYVEYKEVVTSLAVPPLKVSTQKRRGTNVRCLVEFILKNTPREIALANINWKV